MTEFNRFYEACHILREEDPARRASWLRLVELTLRMLELVLDVLGICGPGTDVTMAGPIDHRICCRTTAGLTTTAGSPSRGCDLLGSGRRVHGTPLFVYDEDHLRSPVSGGRRRFRGRGHLRGEGLSVQSHGATRLTKRECESTWRREAKCTLPLPRESRPSGWCCTATTNPMIEAGAGHLGWCRPARRRLLRRDGPYRSGFRRAAPAPDVLIRVNPGVDAHTHEYLKTGADRLEVRLRIEQRRCCGGRGSEHRVRWP